MSLIITYPWARPHGYNLRLKKNKKKKKATSSKRQASSATKKTQLKYINRIIKEKL